MHRIYILLLLSFAVLTTMNAQKFTAKSSKDNNTYYYSVNADGETVTLIKSGKYKKFKTIDIPSEVTYLGKNYKVTILESAFIYCEKLKTVTLPEGIVSVGVACFNGCKCLETVHLPGTLESLSYSMFEQCVKLKHVFINRGKLKTIESFAFINCTSLNSFAIPSTVTRIGENIFRNCQSIQRIVVDGSNENYKAVDGVLFTNDGKGLIAYPPGNSRTDYSIPDGVEYIGNSAFYNARNLKRVYFPNSLKSISHIGFRGCSGLSEITLGNQLSSIGNGAFWDCTMLETVTMNTKTKYTIENRPEDSYNSFMPNVQLNKLDIVPISSNSVLSSSSNFKVTNFMMVTNDISARVNEVIDTNNVPCALIKMQAEDELLSVEGNIVKMDKLESLEKWVYVTDGTKFVKFVFKKHFPITLQVTDYGLEELKGKSTYLLRIE